MKCKVFAVYDSKVEAYLKPFFMQTKGEALRSWEDVVNDDKTMFHKHPEDFTLFEIAEYYEDNARFENHATPISLGGAWEFNRGRPQKDVDMIRSAFGQNTETPRVV